MRHLVSIHAAADLDAACAGICAAAGATTLDRSLRTERCVCVDMDPTKARAVYDAPGVISVAPCDEPVELVRSVQLPEEWAQGYVADLSTPSDFSVKVTGKGASIYNVDTPAESGPDLNVTVIHDPFGPGPHKHGSQTMDVACGQYYGIAPGATAYNAAGFNGNGAGIVSWVNDALDAVANHIEDNAVQGAVVFLSYTFQGFALGDPFAAVMARLLSLGAFIIASSGNGDANNNGFDLGNTNTRVYPATTPGVFTVGGHDINGDWSWFANYGWPVQLHAPAWQVSAMSPDGTVNLVSGTSFSAPIVAGIAALGVEAGETDLWSFIMDAAPDGQIQGVPTIPTRAAQIPASLIGNTGPNRLILGTSGNRLMIGATGNRLKGCAA